MTAVIMPQNWLYLTSYEDMRRRLLTENQWKLLARIGPRAFDSISGEVVNVCAFVLGAMHKPDAILAGIDVYEESGPVDKDRGLRNHPIQVISQEAQVNNPDARILFSERFTGELLGHYAYSHHGLTTGDKPRMYAEFWEIGSFSGPWIPLQSTVDVDALWVAGPERCVGQEAGVPLPLYVGPGRMVSLLGATQESW